MISDPHPIKPTRTNPIPNAPPTNRCDYILSGRIYAERDPKSETAGTILWENRRYTWYSIRLGYYSTNSLLLTFK